MPEQTVSPEDNPLALRLARQIEGSGPISVAEYMRQSNGAYYDKADPLGADGDFITAPEISQMFGELVGLWLTDLWMRSNRPEQCHYVELGPGRGTLAKDALRAMARFDWSPNVHFVETSAALRLSQSQAVPQAAFHESIDSLPEDAPLLIVANEFFDALPVRQAVATHAGWRERVVVHEKDNRFCAMPGSHVVDTQVPEAVRHAPPESIYESAPDAAAILYPLSGRLARQSGALLIIDYGHMGPALGSTLQAVRAHEFAAPFEDPGMRDLTAHVDFQPLSAIAQSLDLRVSGPVEQGMWLQSLGLDQRALALAKQSPERADEILAARNRLAGQDQMGSLFKAMAISAPDWPAPEGF